MDHLKRGVPNWLLFLFFGALIGGGIKIIFLQGFLKEDPYINYRLKTGALYVSPKLSIIPLRTSEAIQKGEQIYEKVCSSCHGVYGSYKSGLVGPSLSDSQWLHSNSEKKIGRLVLNGIGAGKSITGQLMPARAGASLSDSDVWSAVYFLSSQNSSIQKDSTSKK